MHVLFLLFFFCLVAYCLANIGFPKYDNKYYSENTIYYNKIKILPLLVLCLFGTYINHVYFEWDLSSGGLAADLQNYERDFNLGIAATWGLEKIFNCVSYCGGEFKDVCLVTTFITVFLYVIAYNVSSNSKPLSFLYLFSTPVMITAFINIKQTYTSAFASIFIALILSHRSKEKELLIFICIIASCLFHSTGFLLVPLYLLFRYLDAKERVGFGKVFFGIFGFIVLMQPILTFVAYILSGPLPYVASKLLHYFGEDAEQEAESGLLVVLKGIPFYYMNIKVFFRRNSLRQGIENYDQYLVLLTIISFCYIVSFSNYWLPRMVYLIQFPVFMFWSDFLNYLPNKKNVNMVCFMLFLFFTTRYYLLIFNK